MTHSDSPESNPKPKSLLAAIHRIFSRRGEVRIVLFIVVCSATLLGLFHAEENLRGRHAWNKYRNELEAKGEFTDFTRLIPPAVPDDQNFAMTPRLAALFDYIPGTHQPKDSNAWQNVQFEDFGDFNYGEWVTNRMTDLGACLDSIWKAQVKPLHKHRFDPPPTAWMTNLVSSGANRAETAACLLNELKKYDALAQEIEQAAQRPYSRFKLDYEQEDKATLRLPHLACMKAYCRFFSLRASAELAAGQTDRAFQDAGLVLRLIDTVKNEPILISYLVRCACFKIWLQPVWEGLAQRQWNEMQVRAFQEKLQKIDLLQEHLSAMKSERSFGNTMGDFFIAHPGKALFELNSFYSGTWSEIDESPFGRFVPILVPRGWVDFERINYFRSSLQWIDTCVDPVARLIQPEVTSSNMVALKSDLGDGPSAAVFLSDTVREPSTGNGLNRVFRHRFFAGTLLTFTTLSAKTANAQNTVDMALVACALERYRLANGNFPEKLAALAPAFVSKIPHDIINGNPLTYRCADGRFILYSVGWNAKDDGGCPDKDPQTKMERDWVWQYPK